jgi:hypothetical protein
MGTELFLKHIPPDQLDCLQNHGLAANLDNLYETLPTERDSWLLLDEHILGFMYFQQPEHAVLFKAVMRGTPFSDSAGREDYPCFFTPEEVKRVSQALNAVTDEEMLARFDATKEIFGGISVGGTDEDAFARIKRRFREIVDYYRDAAQNGNAMLLLLY